MTEEKATSLFEELEKFLKFLDISKQIKLLESFIKIVKKETKGSCQLPKLAMGAYPCSLSFHNTLFSLIKAIYKRLVDA